MKSFDVLSNNLTPDATLNQAEAFSAQRAMWTWTAGIRPWTTDGSDPFAIWV